MSKNYIIECDDSIQNEKVQIKILSKGYKWSEGSEVTQHINEPVLIFDDLNNKEKSISFHRNKMSEDYRIHSCYHKHIRITAADFLNNINLKNAKNRHK